MLQDNFSKPFGTSYSKPTIVRLQHQYSSLLFFFRFLGFFSCSSSHLVSFYLKFPLLFSFLLFFRTANHSLFLRSGCTNPNCFSFSYIATTSEAAVWGFMELHRTHTSPSLWLCLYVSISSQFLLYVCFLVDCFSVSGTFSKVLFIAKFWSALDGSQEVHACRTCSSENIRKQSIN